SRSDKDAVLVELARLGVLLTLEQVDHLYFLQVADGNETYKPLLEKYKLTQSAEEYSRSILALRYVSSYDPDASNSDRFVADAYDRATDSLDQKIQALLDQRENASFFEKLLIDHELERLKRGVAMYRNYRPPNTPAVRRRLKAQMQRTLKRTVEALESLAQEVARKEGYLYSGSHYVSQEHQDTYQSVLDYLAARKQLGTLSPQ